MASYSKITRLLVAAGIVTAMFTSCKKEIDPKVTVTVFDTLGKPLYNARVLTHPCFDGLCDTSRINEAFVKEAITDAAGQVLFEFPYSAIIDVRAAWTDCDTPTVWCMNAGQTVARFETKKLKKSETNEYNVQVTVYPTP